MVNQLKLFPLPVSALRLCAVISQVHTIQGGVTYLYDIR